MTHERASHGRVGEEELAAFERLAPHEKLGLGSSPSDEEVKAARKRLAKQLHPPTQKPFHLRAYASVASRIPCLA